eukprot:SAG11_NODE_9795_length_880_cov_0.921895_3_plen_52_part_01
MQLRKPEAAKGRAKLVYDGGLLVAAKEFVDGSLHLRHLLGRTGPDVELALRC